MKIKVKKCTRCGVRRPYSSFSKSSKHKYGLSNWCKYCHKDYRIENRDRQREYNRDWCLRNKDRLTAKRRENSFEKKKYDTLRKYGLTYEGYQRMMLQQEGACKICKFLFDDSIESKYPDKPHVDHDHRTGKVRGLLCLSCNHGLGKFKDSVTLLVEAIAYLESSDGV